MGAIYFRSSSLSDITDQGLQTYEDLRIRAIVDLRSASEVESSPDRYPSGVSYNNIPLKDSLGAALLVALETGDTSGLEFDKIVQAYSDFYASNADEYAAILPIIMAEANRPINIHCTQGAVRTGFTVALVQLMLDVKTSEVVDDFLLTNEALASEIEDTVETFRQMIVANTGLEPSAEDIQNLTNFATMHSEYLDSAINGAATAYGSMDSFIRDGLGITDSQRSSFQQDLLQ